MGTRTVKRTPRSGVDGKFLQYVVLGAEAKAISKRVGDLKKDLSEVVDSTHEVDPDKGHLTYYFDEPITVGGITYLGFQKQRRVSQFFLEDVAEALCEEKGLDLDEYTTRVIDQEKVRRLYADDVINDEEFETLFENSETYAFCVVKE